MTNKNPCMFVLLKYVKSGVGILLQVSALLHDYSRLLPAGRAQGTLGTGVATMSSLAQLPV